MDLKGDRSVQFGPGSSGNRAYTGDINVFLNGLRIAGPTYTFNVDQFVRHYGFKEPFGGRSKELAKLDEWLGDRTAPPCAVLTAPAGRGKSALLVAWLASVKQRGHTDIVFAPASGRFKTSAPRAFFSAMLAQLAVIHGDTPQSAIEGEHDAVLHETILKYLTQQRTEGRTLLLIIDGLDELADFRTWAPTLLPLGVLQTDTRILVSARSLGTDLNQEGWLDLLVWSPGETWGFELDRLDRPALAEALHRMVASLAAPDDLRTGLSELIRREDFVAALFDLTKGDPLVAGLYVKKIREEVKRKGTFTTEDLADTSPGLEGFIQAWWAEDFPVGEDEGLNLAEVLAVSQGPLTYQDLRELLAGIRSNKLDDLLRRFERFLLSNVGGQGYTYSHPGIGDHFRSKMSESERASWEKGFVAWGVRTLVHRGVSLE